MLAFLNRTLTQPLIARRRDSAHLRHLAHLERTQFDPPEVVEQRQWLALKRLLRHAYDTVPYYSGLMAKLGLQPEDFRSVADLTWLPALTKNVIRRAGNELVSLAADRTKLALKTTSGSTGVPLRIWVNRESMAWKSACALRADQWSGWRLGEKKALVWGNPEYRQFGLKGRISNAVIDRSRYLDTLGLDSARLDQFCRDMARWKPSLIFGHAHSVYLFACHLRKFAPDSVRPVGIVTTAMPLHGFQRTAIEAALGCKVTDRYGCEEVSLIACECPAHEGMHLNSDNLFSEIVPDAALGHTNQTGRLIVTDLTNYAMPLIRYQVGDVATGAGGRACSCGRGMPLIEKIAGREADFVLTPAGVLVSGISLTENLAMKIPGAAQVQIVQETRSRVVLRVVPEGRTLDAESRRAAADAVRQTLGPDMGHEVEEVAAIPQEASGKYRFCVSPIADEFLRGMAA